MDDSSQNPMQPYGSSPVVPNMAPARPTNQPERPPLAAPEPADDHQPGSWPGPSGQPKPEPRPEPVAAAAAAAPSSPPRRGSILRTLAVFVAGGALTATGFGLGVAVSGDAAAPTGEPAIRTVSQPADGSEGATPLLTVTGQNSVSEVAVLLGPSVVQINTEQGLGSGVVYDDGLIVTNNHVIAGASAVTVRSADGRTVPGEVVGADPRTDIAVVAVDTDHDLPPAQLTTGGPPQVGEATVAIGSPFDLQQTVTAGIVSAVNRPVFNGEGWTAMVQTDAAINPGNSGGALADGQGRVIGINTLIQTDGVSRANAGIGFAVPIDTAVAIANRIVAGEPLEAGVLGVTGEQSDDGQPGAMVATVAADSAAAEAGLAVGDRVVAIDGAPVSRFEELAGLIQTSFPGDEVVLDVIRGGEQLEVTATLQSA